MYLAVHQTIHTSIGHPPVSHKQVEIMKKTFFLSKCEREREHFHLRYSSESKTLQVETRLLLVASIFRRAGQPLPTLHH